MSCQRHQDDITQKRLREALHYDPNTGAFRWKNCGAKNIGAGQVAGSLNSYGYWIIGLDGKNRAAHRLAWLYVHGHMPAADIDHINGIRDDNRIANLRQATRSEQNQNRPVHGNNTTGHPGVYKDRRRNKWRARIWIEGKMSHLGRFETPEEAGAAYRRAKRRLHPFNPNVREA